MDLMSLQAAFHDEVRVDPTDGLEMSLTDFRLMHDCVKSNFPQEALEEYWRNMCQPISVERRVEPLVGKECSFDELCKKYAGQYGTAQCSAFFRNVMPRPCPVPRGIRPNPGSWNANSECCRVAVPFAAAALWASKLPELVSCEGDIDTCQSQPFAIIAGWRYAVNNLRLALGKLSPSEAVKHWGSIRGVHRAIMCLEEFTRQPSKEGFTRSVASAKTVLGAFSGWLEKQEAVQTSMSNDLGLHFLRRSHKLPAVMNAHTVTVAGGIVMPLVGFGTWQMLGNDAYQSVLAALKAGYRHIDTAQLYQNERQIGRAIRESGVPRGDLFISTKLSDTQCFRQARRTVEQQLRDLCIDYVDLYMLHTPADRESNRVAWRDLESLHSAGKIRSLGVSNFGLQELQDLLSFARVPPVYLQNKMSVYAIGEQRVSPRDSVAAFARERGIQLFGYSVNNPWPGVLMPMEDPHVLAVAARYQRTPAQVLLRWALQLGAGVLPKSVSSHRIKENARLFDFELMETDMRLLNGLVTLAESVGSFHAPEWVDDIYGLSMLDR